MGFGSMYVGVTGVNAHGERMNVIGNNIANVSTLGFKGSRTHFQSLMSRDVLSAGSAQTSTGSYVGYSQVGKGVGLGAILTDFRQGGLSNGSETTDLSINGKGFFGVAAPDGSIRYTRAGNFRFDSQGNLTNPQGYVLQGRSIDPATGAVSGTGNIRLPFRQVTLEDGSVINTVASDPHATTAVHMSLNLDLNAEDVTSNQLNPFFALASAWDGTASSPMPASAYSTTIKVFDDTGAAHDLTVSFDKTGVNPGTGETIWEYTVTGDPSQDARAGTQGTAGAGLYMSGTMTFSPSGQLVDQSAFTYSGSGDPKDLANWTPAAFDASGAPAFDASFSGAGASQTVGIDFGLTSGSGGWSAAAGTTAATIGRDASLVPGMSAIALATLNSTSYDKSSFTATQSQDGYAQGLLQNVTVDADGYIVGDFTNGRSERLHQIDLYRFTSEFGLRHEGGSLFSAGSAAGTMEVGAPNQDGFGSLQQMSLENSNVDLAEQFTDMILTQRGYQANTKVISTADTLLQTLTNLKR